MQQAIIRKPNGDSFDVMRCLGVATGSREFMNLLHIIYEASSLESKEEFQLLVRYMYAFKTVLYDMSSQSGHNVSYLNYPANQCSITYKYTVK